MSKLLSIQIPTVVGREESFNYLFNKLNEQVEKNNLQDEVEVIYCVDDKQSTIGKKRYVLYQMSEGMFSVQIDDDDDVHDEFVKKIVDVIKENPKIDSIGYYERHLQDGIIIGKNIFSRKYYTWGDNPHPIYGIKYFRTPFFKTPIITELCRQIPLEVYNMRFGEDHAFAKAIHPFLKNEVFIHEEMYIYRFNSKEKHDDKYGIKK